MSLGVQSTVPHVLAGLGRRHGADQVAEAAAAVAGAGLSSWNMDLIIGGAGERDADWERSLGEVIGMADPPPHVSAYALTVEPGTPLAGDPARHPDDDAQAGRYERADAVLDGAGYRWEEISNWARPGHECRHNRLYWEQGDYRGIGSAAHSHRAGRRWWNVRTPDRYVALVAAGRADHRRRGGAHRRSSGGSRRWPSRCGPRPGSPPTPWPTTRTSTGWSTERPGGPCSPCAAGCWPMR